MQLLLTPNTSVKLLGFEKTKYNSEGTLAVLAHLRFDDGLEEKQPISVNLDESVLLDDGQFFLKDWSELKLLAKSLFDNGLIEPILMGGEPISIPTGYVRAKLVKLTEKGRSYLN